MVCEPSEMTLVPFSYRHCETPPLYVPATFTFPFEVFGSRIMMSVSDFQLHVAMLVVFASFVAPFSGFLASGFKRAVGIKDFADTIPGHGGLVDRFDCHIYMVNETNVCRESLRMHG